MIKRNLRTLFDFQREQVRDMNSAMEAQRQCNLELSPPLLCEAAIHPVKSFPTPDSSPNDSSSNETPEIRPQTVANQPMTMAMKLKLSQTETAAVKAKKVEEVKCPSTGNVKVKQPEAEKKLETSQYRLFVGHLGFATTEESVRAHFKKFGEIEDVYFPPSKEGSLHRGYCFVTFNKFFDKHPLKQRNHKIDGK